ncbi:protein takeout [Leptinotarsa decemlineata]|uniref:protein takeout n=1 Tax=Leptinotarsa decemlineata TaxID=7539 RepID=UPI000C252078|nr:protein takeout-like [Leptinotarsa decemlineata]
MGVVLLFCLLVTLTEIYGRKDLPTNFPRCRRSDENLSKCILQAMEKARPFLVKGIPEINLPPFDPLYVESVNMDQETQALSFKANLTNAFVYGFTNYACPRFEYRSQVPTLHFATRCFFKEVKLVSDYVIAGKIFGSRIEGTGNLTAVFSAGDANVTEIAKIVKKRGVDYLRVHETKISIGVQRISARLDGLFDGNKELGDTMNKLINNNIDEIFRQVTPFFEELLTNIADNLLLRAFTQVPYDKLFPK